MDNHMNMSMSSSSSSGDDDDIEMDSGESVIGRGPAQKRKAEDEPLFIGSDSSSSGDERARRKNSGPILISGKGRTAEEELHLEEQRQVIRRRLDEEEAMREQDQADMEEELEEQEPVGEQAILEQWKKVQEERRKPALEEKETSDVKAERVAWKREADAKGDKPPNKKKKKSKKARNQEPVPATEEDVQAATSHLESAAQSFEVFAKARQMPAEQRRKMAGQARLPVKSKMTLGGKELPPTLKYLADFARACVITYLWAGNKETPPHPDDSPVISLVFQNANLFIEAGKTFGDRAIEASRKVFMAKNNTALVSVLTAVVDTLEVHLQPTVRKSPTPETVDVWTGETLTKQQLRRMSSIVFNPNETEREPNSVVASKNPATMFGLLHFMAHFDAYCKEIIHAALADYHGKISATMRWAEVWSICVGSSLSKKNYMDWPKTGGTVTEFSEAVVRLRELVRVSLWLEKLLESEAEAADE